MKLQTGMIMLMSMTLLFAEIASAKSPERKEIATDMTWDLSDLYADDAAWEQAKDRLSENISTLQGLRGTLGRSGRDLLNALELSSTLSREYVRLSSYASMKNDQDTRIAFYSGMEKEIQQVGTEFSTLASFIEPEILAIHPETLQGFIAAEKGLQAYDMYLYDLRRRAEHTLSEKEEAVIAKAGLMSSAPSSIFGTFANAEFPYPSIRLKNGEEVTLDQSGYSLYRALPDREDRKAVFDAFWTSMASFKMTFGEQLYAGLKRDMFYSQVRGYDNSLQAALDRHNIPRDVYIGLIENVNEHLPTFHRYLDLKRRLLGLDSLFYYDIYAPSVKNVDPDYSLNEAKALILKSLEPMGKEYRETVNRAFDNRWIDFLPNQGKRSGAYSNGSAYDVHPYILMNYNGKYSDVSTLTHELGHTMHSYFSNRMQPFPKADYSIFVAEVASTLNEALLMNTMLENEKDDELRLALLMNYLDGMRGTLWRQTQFAEFELKTHMMAEQGEALTGENFTAVYGEILRKYYGHDSGVCSIPPSCNYEWTFIPHFYYNFYVYQYATSFTASTALSERIISKEAGAVQDVMQFLSAGGSKYPVDILMDAGVDMTGAEPFKKTMAAMNRAMDEIEKILAKRKS